MNSNLKSKKLKNALTVIFISAFAVPRSFASFDAKDINAEVAISNSQNLSHGVEADKINSTNLGVTFNTKLSSVRVGLLSSVSTENNHQGQSSIGDTVLLLQEIPKVVLQSQNTSSIGFSVTLPTNTDLRKETRFNGGISAFHTLSGNSNSMVIPISYFWSLSLAKNFHEYDLGNEGQALIELSVKNKLGITFNLTHQLAANILLNYINGLTYQKTTREKFSSSAELSYKMNERLAANFGVSTEGNAQKTNGMDSNVSFFDENVSTIESGITLVF